MRVSPGMENNAETVARLREMNVNWVQLTLWPQVTQDGKIIEHPYGTGGPDYSPQSVDRVLEESAITEEVMVSAIKRWHELGFKVYLLVYHERLGDHHAYGHGLTGDIDSMLEQAKEIAVKWARIAEENKVEMYAPRKELQMFVGAEKALEWDKGILPEVRSAYSGILVQGIPFMYLWDRINKEVYLQEQVAAVETADITGYDYLGIDFYGSDVDTFEELEAIYARFLLKTEELKQKFGVKGVVFEELGFPHHGTEAFWNDSSLTGDEIICRSLDIFYRLGIGRIDGFFPWLFGDEFDGVAGLPAGRQEYIAPTKIISHYYTSVVAPVSDIEGIAAPEATFPGVSWEVSGVLLREDFNDDTAWGLWGSGTSVNNGVLEIIGEGGAPLNNPDAAAWGNYVFRGRFKPIDGEVSLQFRDSDVGSYSVMIKPITDFSLLKFTGPRGAQHMDQPRTVYPLIAYNKWHSFAIYAKGSALEFFIDEKKVTDYWDEEPLLNGSVAVGVRGHVLFDDFLVEELR